MKCARQRIHLLTSSSSTHCATSFSLTPDPVALLCLAPVPVPAFFGGANLKGSLHSCDTQRCMEKTERSSVGVSFKLRQTTTPRRGKEELPASAPAPGTVDEAPPKPADVATCKKLPSFERSIFCFRYQRRLRTQCFHLLYFRVQLFVLQKNVNSYLLQAHNHAVLLRWLISSSKHACISVVHVLAQNGCQWGQRLRVTYRHPSSSPSAS